MDEKQLIRQAQAGDFAAFTTLINAYKTRVYGLARRLTRNEQDAEDIVQETFLKAVDNIDQFRGEASFGTWLHAIALNLLRAHASKEHRRELRSIEEYLPAGSDGESHGTARPHLTEWRDPHSLLEAEELRRTLDRAIADLPYIYREAFVLRYHDDLSVKEIAEIIGESEAATKSRILRARLALREQLAKEFEDTHDQKMS